MSSHYFSNRIFFNFKSIKFHCKSSIFINSKLRFHFTHAKKNLLIFTFYFSLLSSLAFPHYFHHLILHLSLTSLLFSLLPSLVSLHYFLHLIHFYHYLHYYLHLIHLSLTSLLSSLAFLH